MLRRDFLGMTLSMSLLRESLAAAADTVQLILIRSGPEPNACSNIRFTKGNLYGVPNGINLMEVISPVGLRFISRTEELPFQLNVPKVSSIPADTYIATIRNDRTKQWMINENRAWRLELLGMQPRSAIQFHYGKDFHWSEGCVILTGDDSSDLVCQEGANSPERAVAALRDYVTTGHNSSTKIILRIMFSST